jgi:drug/metabolite transporter (DMT)-like permease
LNRESLRDNLVLALLVLIWGTTWSVNKLGLNEIPPFRLSALRLTIAAIFLAGIVCAWKIPMPRGKSVWRAIIVLSVIMLGLPNTVHNYGQQYVQSNVAALLNASLPFWGALFAHLMLREEPLTRGLSLGLCVGFAGCAILSLSEGVGSGLNSMVGVALVLLSAAIWGFANVYAKLYAGQFHPLSGALIQMTLGALFAWALTPLDPHPSPSLTPRLWLLVAGLGSVGMALPFALYYLVLPRVTATRMAMLTYLEPVVAQAMGFLLLAEMLTAPLLYGGALILLGVWIVTRER